MELQSILVNIFPGSFFRPNIPAILVANEPHLEEGERGERVVSTTEGEKLALKLKVRFNVKVPQIF